MDTSQHRWITCRLCNQGACKPVRWCNEGHNEVYAGKYMTEDKARTGTLQKLNTTQKK